ncbi:uncharacterized protein LOC130782189 [Actinidia eriantha]|uniref:uncharacterized protein LOC130782189 n=1 Tax=Actinidia eriantha TaxID=165200 RepID=UPI00258FF05A|nr:uncharacterized protein LOC130782189 [Actinidia eriantha]
MGKLNSQPDPTIHHFSHPHTLHLTNHQPQQTLALASCSSCKHTVSGCIYTCQSCNYFLHVKCAQMPQKIKHPFHQNHVLSLLPTPTYPEVFFNCHACQKQGNGFSYHCKACKIDLHVLCASMPMTISHQFHQHQLDLVFSPPYHNKSFSCDICKSSGSNHWLYRCGLCGFDAHLTCATTKPPIQATRAALGFLPTYAPNNFANPLGGFGSVNRMNSYNFMNQATPGSFSGGGQAPRQQLFPGQMGGGDATARYLQAIMAGGTGTAELIQLMGSGGGNPQLMQALMGGAGGANAQLMQALVGAGGTSGGNSQLMQALMGGGGAGAGGGTAQLLQQLMGGGGGGGTAQLLQQLMGGGGANFDLSSLLGGLGGLGGLL